MSMIYSPATVSNNIVLLLDAANIKSYPFRSAVSNSAYSTWYCFVSGTATYSMTVPGSEIYENNAGTITTVVSSSAIPKRGTFAITAGRTYYSNGPIFLTVEDAQHSIAPVTMAASTFIHYAARNNPGTVYVYAPIGATTINFYDATATGINGTVTSTLSLSQGQSGTINLANLGWSYFTSTLPVVMTTTQSGADKTRINPATQTVYNRYQAYYNTAINTTPSTVGSYVVSNTAYPVMNITIADGSGGDCAQGLGLEFLSANYSWGNVLSDYVIVAPYDNTFINVAYWNGSSWITWDTHALTGGTTLNPVYVARDGTQGPGVPATNISGSAADMASGATLWRWTGTNPFYLGLNDSVDDEVSMLGWNASSNAFVLGYNNVWYDSSTTGLIGSPNNGVTYNSGNNGYFNFDSTRSQSISLPSNAALQFLNRLPYSFEVWVYPISDTSASYPGFIDRESNLGSGRDGYLLYYTKVGIAAGSNYVATERWGAGTVVNVGTTLTDAVFFNNWQCYCVTYDGTTLSFYRNGALVNSSASTANITNATKNVTIGVRGGVYSNSRIATTRFYNTSLTAAQVAQNFQALRGRYGI